MAVDPAVAEASESVLEVSIDTIFFIFYILFWDLFLKKNTRIFRNIGGV